MQIINHKKNKGDEIMKNKKIKHNKKETQVLSHLDETLIKLHELYQNKEIVISINMKVTEDKGKYARTFSILDCFTVIGGHTVKTQRPDYLG